MQTTVKILGGLEVTVEFDACWADHDVGIMSDYVENWHIVEIAGRPLRKTENCDWIYKRIEISGEEDKILAACYDAMYDARASYFSFED